MIIALYLLVIAMYSLFLFWHEDRKAFGERELPGGAGHIRERVAVMTADLIHTAYAKRQKPASDRKLELTRSEGFLDGALDIFDLLGGSGQESVDGVDVKELLKTAYRAIARSETTIREQKQRIEALESVLTTDELTGITNRRGFFQTLGREMDRVNRDLNEGGLLIMIDLDNFKAINDTYGHQAGDACLKKVADFLMGEIRAMDTAARLGGDEFILLFPRTNREKAMKRAQQMALRLNNLTAEWNGKTIPITASVGLRNFISGDRIEDILESADQEMYEQKQGRKALAH
jgi:diguanylate cyclase (GGDEF)-like protein